MKSFTTDDKFNIPDASIFFHSSRNISWQDGFINRTNITTGQKSGRLQALASKVTTLFLSPAQGTVQPHLETCEEPAQSQSTVRPCVLSPFSALVCHGLGEWAPAPLGLFQSVQDKLAGVNESLHAVNEARFCPQVHFWPRFIHAFLLETAKKPWKVVTHIYNSFPLTVF